MTALAALPDMSLLAPAPQQPTALRARVSGLPGPALPGAMPHVGHPAMTAATRPQGRGVASATTAFAAPTQAAVNAPVPNALRVALNAMTVKPNPALLAALNAPVALVVGSVAARAAVPGANATARPLRCTGAGGPRAA